MSPDEPSDLIDGPIPGTGEAPPGPVQGVPSLAQLSASPVPAGPAAATVPLPPRRSRRRGVGVVLAVVAVVGAIGGKVVLGILTATVVGSIFSSAFGGPWDRLPSDVRDSLGQRLQAALGDRLRGLSDADASGRVASMLAGGLPRLDDATLVDRFTIATTALKTVDVATCAAFVRDGVAGTTPPVAIAEKVVDALDTATLERWFEINVEAIEADARGAPPARAVSPDASSKMFADVLGLVPAADQATLRALIGGTPTPDAATCTAATDLYSTAIIIGGQDLDTIALYDVTP